jgi:hypothetical protein
MLVAVCLDAGDEDTVMTKLKLAALACAGGCIATAAFAAGMKLDVKPGLWETTMTMQNAGTPPIADEQMSQMSPEQRQHFMAAMQGAMARAAQPHVTKSCLTEEQLRKGPPMGAEPDPDCKRNIAVDSSSQWEMHEECTGAHKRSVTAKFHANSDESVDGLFDVVMTGGSNTMTSKGTMHAKWLGRDCGGIKPSNTGD